MNKNADKIPPGSRRSSSWPKARKQHLSINPSCVVCGGDKRLEVHHVKPFHLHPELELDATNLITLCENEHNGINCHLAFGHLGSFKSVNDQVRTDAMVWALKIKDRP